MRNCGYWVVCAGLLVPQLGCWGDAVSVDSGVAAIAGAEPGAGPTPDEPIALGKPLTPLEGELATPAEPTTLGAEQPAAPGEAPPFNSDSCSIFPQFRVDTPLNDTRGTGFSALEMVSIFNEQGPGTLTWFDGRTTTLSISVRVTGSTSDVDDPPRGEGHCVPFREVPVQLRIESADGRFAEDVASQLVAVGYDGNIESIWLSDARLSLGELQGSLDVPSDWLIAGHTERRLDFDTAWVPPDGLSPFCLPSDVPSSDASEACNVHSGVVRFFSSTPHPSSAEDPADYDQLSQSYERFRGVVGYWVLAR